MSTLSAPTRRRSRRTIAALASLTVVGCLVAAAPAPQQAGPQGEPPAPAAPAVTGEFPDSWYYTDRSTGARYKQLIALEGKKAPVLKVHGWMGDPQDLAKLAEKDSIVVVDFWGTWCSPCVRAIPKNIEMMKKWKDDNFVIIGVHDSKRGRKNLELIHKRAKINYPVAIDRDGGPSARAWKVMFWPTYAVVDHHGVVRAAGLNPLHVENVAKKLIAERDAELARKRTEKKG